MKGSKILLILALLFGSVCAHAQKGKDTATLVIAHGRPVESDRGVVSEKIAELISKQSGAILVRRVITDSDGNIYIAASYRGIIRICDTVLKGVGAHNYDFFLAKCSPSNTCLWITRQGGHGNEVALDLAVDELGQAYLFAGYDSVSVFYGLRHEAQGIYDGVVIKYNASGQPAWIQNIASGIACPDCRYGSSIAVDRSGNVFVASSFTDSSRILGATLTSNGKIDFFLVKLASDGAFIWVRQYNGPTDEQLCRIAIGERLGVSECIAVIWDDPDPERKYIWYDQEGILLSTEVKTTTQ